MTRVHELKCWPEHFAAVRRREKTFEVRFNDRDYRAGDTLILREWIPPERWIEQYQGDGYTGETETVTVTYVLDDPRWCKPGYVVLGLGVERGMNDECISIANARAALSRLCKGDFRMRVPVQSDDDDMILSAALDELERLRAEIVLYRQEAVHEREQ